MPAGLFPSLYCPSHYFPMKWIACPLSIVKMPWLLQLPLSFDSLLGGLEPDKGLPFEDSPTPDLFTIFFQLWGVIGGCYGLDSCLKEIKRGLEVEINEGVDKGSGSL
jgi:hypothetical protein